MDTPAPAVLPLPAAIREEEVDVLRAHVRARLRPGGVVVCDARGIGGLGLGAVELLARLELTAMRAGGHIRVTGASPGLRALLELLGLRIQLGGEAEEREEAVRVQEGREPDDPAR